MIIINAHIVGQSVQMTNLPLLASGIEGALEIRCTFSEEWDGYAKTAVFYRNEEVFHVLLTAGEATVPAEVLTDKGSFYFGIMGTAEGGLTLTTEVLRVNLVKGAVTTATAEPSAPAPNIYEDLLSAYGTMDSRLSELVAMRGSGVTEQTISGDCFNGTIYSNGAAAFISLEFFDLPLAANSERTDFCIPPAFAPLGLVTLTSLPNGPQAVVSITPRSWSGTEWAGITITNPTGEDLVDAVEFEGYYDLESVFIPELADCRVDVGGVRYETAGAAIRVQVQSARNSIPSKETVDNKYVDSTSGATVGTTAWGYKTFNVYGLGTIAEIKTALYQGSTAGWAFYDKSGNYISGGTYLTDVAVPSNAYTIKVCCMKNAYALADIQLVADYDNTLLHQFDKEEINANINKVEKELFTHEAVYYIEQKDVLATGRVNGGGEFEATMTFRTTDYLPIDTETIVKYKISPYTGISTLSFFDMFKQYISGMVGDFTADWQRPYIEGVADIPKNAKYVRATFLANSDEHFGGQFVELTHKAIKQDNTNPLKGKILTATGDSITAATYSVPGRGYVEIIGTVNEMTVENKAIWGSVFPTGVVHEGNAVPSVLPTIEQMRVDADFVILSGGINDCSHIHAGRETLGTITSNYYSALDTTTFCGAFESMLKQAVLKWQGKTIIYVIEHKMMNEDEPSGIFFKETFYPALVQMLEKWGIPYVDLYKQVPTLCMIPELRDRFTFDADGDGVGDGWHPNFDGYINFYYSPVQAKLREFGSRI